MSAKPLPPGVPAPPEGYVYVGAAPLPDNHKILELSFWYDTSRGWETGLMFGSSKSQHYAVEPGSPAARACGVPDAFEPKTMNPALLESSRKDYLVHQMLEHGLPLEEIILALVKDKNRLCEQVIHLSGMVPPVVRVAKHLGSCPSGLTPEPEVQP